MRHTHVDRLPNHHESSAERLPSFFRSLIVALLLFEGGLQAQPLVETYKRQEELRLRVAEICDAQFEKAQYHPVEGQDEDLRWMISAKGVQAIKAVVIPRSGGSYKCGRERYEQPMLLGRTYTTSLAFLSSDFRARCAYLLRSGMWVPPACTVSGVRKERLELEPCSILGTVEGVRARSRGESYMHLTIETSCLISYTQLNDGLVNRSILAYRRRPQSG
jgi:hypothetical protein